jgi:hypothetical protein
MKTSKIYLFIWLLLGIALLIFTKISTNHLVLYLTGLVVLLWNRLDSRGRAYKFQVHGPGGSRITLSADDENAFEVGEGNLRSELEAPSKAGGDVRTPASPPSRGKDGA